MRRNMATDWEPTTTLKNADIVAGASAYQCSTKYHTTEIRDNSRAHLGDKYVTTVNNTVNNYYLLQPSYNTNSLFNLPPNTSARTTASYEGSNEPPSSRLGMTNYENPRTQDMYQSIVSSSRTEKQTEGGPENVHDHAYRCVANTPNYDNPNGLAAVDGVQISKVGNHDASFHTYFLPNKGIDREVITRDINRYLGCYASVRPATSSVSKTREMQRQI